MCLTPEMLRPFQSTVNLDGAHIDRETEMDIAYDGDTAGRAHEQRPQSVGKTVWVRPGREPRM